MKTLFFSALLITALFLVDISYAMGQQNAVREGVSPKDTVKTSPVAAKDKKLEVTFNGRVHRMLLNVDDGTNNDLYFMDSDQGPTMLRFNAKGKVNKNFSIGAFIETGIRQNRPLLISQDNREAGTSVNVRIAEIVLESMQLGKFSYGRGFASAWLTSEVDFSGTQFASLLAVGMLAPGMKFVNASNDSLSNIQVLTYFVDLERLLLVDRFRYDSPVFGPGVQISGSVANDSRWDLSLRFRPQKLENWKVVIAGAYLNKPFEGIDQRWDAGVSLLHNQTGLNLTLGSSIEMDSTERSSNNWIIKAGWLKDIFSIGKTAFSVDYFTTNDLRIQGDEAKSIGIFAVQKFADLGFESYLGYRNYTITRPDVELKDLSVFVMGMVLNF